MALRILPNCNPFILIYLSVSKKNSTFVYVLGEDNEKTILLTHQREGVIEFTA